MDDAAEMTFSSQADWAAWLAQNHASSPGVWLLIAKKDGGARTVSYAEALDVALCYGWIDGRKGARDETHWLQRFTPRTARSRWSRINRDKAQALIDAGRMQPAGLAEVERAKADGRWDSAYAGQRTAEIPADLAEALAADDAAREFFATLNSANRYAILYRIQDAKRPQTRAQRIAKFVAMLANHETIHPQ